jgi:S1-C subfamily serine protease
MKLLFKYLLTITFIAFYVILAAGSGSSNQATKISVPSVWPTLSTNEIEIKKYFDENKDKLDPIEGIYSEETTASLYDGSSQHSWQVLNYRIAIVNREKFPIIDEPSYEFIAIILESEQKEWFPGRIKSFFRKTANPKFYECKWFMQDYSPSEADFKIYNSGLNSNSPNINLYRKYPLLESPKSSEVNKSTSDATSTSEVKKSNSDEVSLKGTGSGFLISNTGLIVTNYHVVAEGSRFEIDFPLKGITKKAKVKMKDMQNDIAILEIENFSLNEISSNEIPYAFPENSSVKVGQEVYTLGFPLGDIMGTTPRLATGNINSLYGLQDDPRLYQINNSLQPGNSGGALFNKKGELVGICVSGLNAKYFYENQGIIPQNMNFAIKTSYLINLIAMLPQGDEILKRINTVKQGTLEEQIEQLNPFIVQIKVY